jgi:anti-sigma factor RsiW
MNCDEAKTLLDDLAEGGLDAKSAARVRAHVSACASCRRELASIEAVNRGLATVKPLRAPERATGLVMAEVRAVDVRRRRAAYLVKTVAWAAAAGIFLVLSSLDLSGVLPISHEAARFIAAANHSVFRAFIRLRVMADPYISVIPAAQAIYWLKVAGIAVAGVFGIIVVAAEGSFAGRTA